LVLEFWPKKIPAIPGSPRSIFCLGLNPRPRGRVLSPSPIQTLPAASVPAASGHYRVEVHEAVAAGGKEHLRGRQYHITAPHRRSTSPLPPFLGPDRRRHLLDFGILSGNLPVLSPSLFLSAGRGSSRYVVVAPCLELIHGVSGGGPFPCGARMAATSAPLPCFMVPGRVGRPRQGYAGRFGQSFRVMRAATQIEGRSGHSWVRRPRIWTGVSFAAVVAMAW
jgi:hypothetical protein